MRIARSSLEPLKCKWFHTSFSSLCETLMRHKRVFWLTYRFIFGMNRLSCSATNKRKLFTFVLLTFDLVTKRSFCTYSLEPICQKASVQSVISDMEITNFGKQTKPSFANWTSLLAEENKAKEKRVSLKNFGSVSVFQPKMLGWKTLHQTVKVSN